MFFSPNASLEQITEWAKSQIAAVHPVAKNGIDITIKPHNKQRTNQQNRFFSVIVITQIRFFHDTGFMASGLEAWMHQPEILRFYWKARYGIEHTSKLSTKAFGEFIDFIQHTLVQESGGNWEVISPDSMYLQSLIAGYLE